MFPWFINNTLAAAGLALVVFLVCRFGRFRPAVQHALWLVVLIKLLTPAWLVWPWSPRDFFPQPANPETVSLPADAPAVRATTLALVPTEAQPVLPKQREAGPQGLEIAAAIPQNTGDSLATVAEASKGRQAARATRDVQDSPPAESWMAVFTRWFWQATHWFSQAVLYLWAAGAIALLLVQSAQAIRFRRLIARGQPISGELADELGRLAVQMRVSPPPARRVPDLVSPVLWCLGKPTLLWPSTLEQNLASGATRSLLLHELAHLRRRDHWVAWLEGLALLVWWWNPLFWFVRRRLRQCAEMACDAWVVWALPDARRTYAESLVAVTELASQSRAVIPAWGAIGEARNLERRLTMIFRNDVRRDLSRSGLVVILLLALLVLPGWSWGQDEEKAEPANPQGASTFEPVAENPPVVEPAAPSTPVGPPPAVPAGKPLSAATIYAAPASESSSAAPLSPAVPTATLAPSSTMNARPSATPVQPPRMPGAAPQGGASGTGLHLGVPHAVQPTRRGLASPQHIAALGVDPEAEPMSIRVFPLRNHDPAEMIRMINTLWELSADQVAVIAFVPEPEPPGQAPITYSPMEVPGAPGVVNNAPVVGTVPVQPRRTGGGGPLFDRPGAALSTPRLAADSPTKSLIVRGTPQQIEQVAQLVAALDTPDESLSKQVEKLGNVRGLTPQHRSLEEIASVLESLGIPVRTVPVRVAGEPAGPSRGSLIVIGPENDVAEIQKLVQSLDVENRGAGTEAEPGPHDMPLPSQKAE